MTNYSSNNLNIKVDDSVELRLLNHETDDSVYALIMQNYDYLKEWVFWVNEKFDRKLAKHFTDLNLQSFAEQKAYIMGVYVDGKLVGSVDVRDIVPGDSAEVGYWIAEDFTGRGLASRCTMSLIDYVRQKHGVKHFYLLTLVDNIASVRVAEKMGFTFDSIVHNDKYNIQEKRYVKNYEQ